MSDLTNDVHTITLKGPQNGDPWLVLKGRSINELEETLLRAFPAIDPEDELPSMIYKAHVTWNAIRNVVVGAAPGVVSAPQTAYQAAPQAPAQPAAPAAPQGAPAPSCLHGPRVFREAKPGSGKTWKGWFCPTAQGTPDQCKPQFVK